MPDTDDLALWYALNRLMTNYWADVDGRRMSFICWMRSTLSATIGSRESKRSEPSMLGAGSAAEP